MHGADSVQHPRRPLCGDLAPDPFARQGRRAASARPPHARAHEAGRLARTPRRAAQRDRKSDPRPHQHGFRTLLAGHAAAAGGIRDFSQDPSGRALRHSRTDHRQHGLQADIGRSLCEISSDAGGTRPPDSRSGGDPAAAGRRARRPRRATRRAEQRGRRPRRARRGTGARRRPRRPPRRTPDGAFEARSRTRSGGTGARNSRCRSRGSQKALRRRRRTAGGRASRHRRGAAARRRPAARRRGTPEAGRRPPRRGNGETGGGPGTRAPPAENLRNGKRARHRHCLLRSPPGRESPPRTLSGLARPPESVRKQSVAPPKRASAGPGGRNGAGRACSAPRSAAEAACQNGGRA